VDDVTKVLRDFTALVGSSFDKIEALKALASKHNLEYLNMLGPVGAVLSTTLSVVVKVTDYLCKI
jgi:hypothetical protein